MLTPDTPSISNSSTAPPLLGPGDVIKNSGKFAKPTRIPGKNCSKDEIVIRNSDSGKGKNKFTKLFKYLSIIDYVVHIIKVTYPHIL